MVDNIVDSVTKKIQGINDPQSAGILPECVRNQAVNVLQTDYAKNIIGQAISEVIRPKKNPEPEPEAGTIMQSDFVRQMVGGLFTEAPARADAPERDAADAGRIAEDLFSQVIVSAESIDRDFDCVFNAVAEPEAISKNASFVETSATSGVPSLADQSMEEVRQAAVAVLPAGIVGSTFIGDVSDGLAEALPVPDPVLIPASSAQDQDQDQDYEDLFKNLAHDDEGDDEIWYKIMQKDIVVDDSQPEAPSLPHDPDLGKFIFIQKEKKNSS